MSHTACPLYVRYSCNVLHEIAYSLYGKMLRIIRVAGTAQLRRSYGTWRRFELRFILVE
jgi:hypothetical protein